MEEFIKKYKKMLAIRKIYTGLYFLIMFLAFLGGLAGIIVCGINNHDSFLIVCFILCIVVPPVMIVLYLTFLIVGKDKKREALDYELENSSLTADDIMQIAEEVKIDLFYVALCKRAKELGIERVPEWCIRDGVLPVKEDILS